MFRCAVVGVHFSVALIAYLCVGTECYVYINDLASPIISLTRIVDMLTIFFSAAVVSTCKRTFHCIELAVLTCGLMWYDYFYRIRHAKLAVTFNKAKGDVNDIAFHEFDVRPSIWQHFEIACQACLHRALIPRFIE